ncbi:MAG: DUF547 domain-containing protein [Planctomycetes bacterium]|nr:DUF547 domain-containing protein [Planctomycetota bacterium]
MGVVVGVAGGCVENALRPDASLLRELRNQPYSDRDWAIVLRDNVRYGLVDYQTLRANPEPLLRYCALVGLTGPTRTPDQFPGRTHETAYYVNAYNALVLWAVLSRPQDPPTMYDYSMPQLEYDYHFTLDGAMVTLMRIEDKMLKASGGDVRTLLATSRAAMGTPRLAGEPLRPETLDRQLADAAAEALDLPEILRIDHSTRSIQVWQLIMSRQNDFIEWWKDQRRLRTAYLFNVLLELASPQKRRALQSAVGYSFRGIAFDRSLNRWERRADRPLVP